MAPRARLVRRQPFLERVKAYINPWDFLLWASEELNGNDGEDIQKQWSIPFGIALNVVFMVARANSGAGLEGRRDDVFGDYYERRGSGWLRWFASFVVHALTTLSILNAVYTFQRKRHYRLFEASIDNEPSTPSAHRVRVDSSPQSSSPLSYLSNILATPSAASRAHPDPTRDVWQVAVWDPTPMNLRLFNCFSPGHVLVYWLFLPLAPLDPRPSVTVATAIVLVLVLTLQLSFLQSNFTQQSKDSALIHKEVQNEYDTKFVHPNMYRPMRDVATQTPPSKSRQSNSTPSQTNVPEVTTYTPAIIVNRGFRTNPNPAYAAFYDPDGQTDLHSGAHRSHLPQHGAMNYDAAASSSGLVPLRSATTPNILHSSTAIPNANGSADMPLSSPLKSPAALRQPDFRHGTPAMRRSIGVGTGGGSGDGGSFGVYSHAQSPLKQRHSAGGAMLPPPPQPPAMQAQGAARPRSPQKREGSPLKMSSSAGDMRGHEGSRPRFSMPQNEGQGRRR